MKKGLFRAKSAITGEWVYGYLFFMAEDTEYEEAYILKYVDQRESVYDIWKYAEKIDQETIGEFTGLLDKEGNKIFEDDIVETKFGRLCFVTWFSSAHTVGWDLSCIYTSKNLSKKAPQSYDLFAQCNLKVVGNAYDNREFWEDES